MRATCHAALVVLALVTLAGCATPSSPKVTPPPTSASVSPSADAQQPGAALSNKINPCSLLTSSQQENLAVYTLRKYPTYDPDESQCGWTSTAVNNDASWIAKLQFGQPFPTTLESPAPTQRLRVDGYTALQGSNPNFTPDSSCVQFISVGPNLTLVSSYVTSSTAGSTDRQQTCAAATRFSEMLIKNLRAQTGR